MSNANQTSATNKTSATSATNLIEDRNYYQMLSDNELIELTKTIKTSELAIVLAERLKNEKRRRAYMGE